MLRIMHVFTIMNGACQARPIPYSKTPPFAPCINDQLIEKLEKVSPAWPKNFLQADRKQIEFRKEKWENPKKIRRDNKKKYLDEYPEEYEYICTTIKKHLDSTLGKCFCVYPNNTGKLCIRMGRYEPGSEGQDSHDDYLRPGCISLSAFDTEFIQQLGVHAPNSHCVCMIASFEGFAW